MEFVIIKSWITENTIKTFMIKLIHFLIEFGSLIPKIENTIPNTPKLPPTMTNKSANPSQAAGDGKTAISPNNKTKQIKIAIEQ